MYLLKYKNKTALVTPSFYRKEKLYIGKSILSVYNHFLSRLVSKTDYSPYTLGSSFNMSIYWDLTASSSYSSGDIINVVIGPIRYREKATEVEFNDLRRVKIK